MKRFLSEVQQGLVPSTWWTFGEVGHNDEAQKAVGELLGRKIFDTPKPVRLLDRILTIATSKDSIILDFFAGSGTTGHAVMAQNAADGGNRRYVLVQLPEPLDPAKAEQKTAADFCDTLGKPRTIAELTKERLRRAGEKVKKEFEAGPPPTPPASGRGDLDVGFRVYKLSSSNLKPWSPGDDLAADLLDAAGNILPGRSEEDLLVELLLKTGIDLTLPAETREIAGCTVHLLGGGTLMVCLSDIPADKARALGDGIADWLAEVAPPAPTTFFFKDSGFDAAPGGAIGPRSAEARANLAATLRQRLGKDAIEKLGAI
jgi:adenine-specific DNA-methyltransferase